MPAWSSAQSSESLFKSIRHFRSRLSGSMFQSFSMDKGKQGLRQPRMQTQSATSDSQVLPDAAKSGIVKRPSKRRPPSPAASVPSVDDGEPVGVQTPPSKKKPKATVQVTSFEITEELRGKAAKITKQLGLLFPDPPIPLNHASPFQLLTAVVLSAQSTDVKVNEVTPALFALAPDAASMSKLPVPTVEGLIRVLGLAPTKARNLVALSKMLVEQHGGSVPDTFEALESLPGVGHKTASVVLSQVFNKLAFPVDTHIHRLAQRWGLTNGRSVEQTEADLKALIPERQWRDAHLQIIFFGRQHCPSQRHDPNCCPICSWAAVAPYDEAGNSPARPGKQPPARPGKLKS